MRKMALFLLILRLSLGGLFVFAGLTKLANPSAFLTDVENYRLLPYVPAVAFSLYLPWLEIFGGACVVFRKLYPGALAILLGLIVLFTAALLSAWARGLDISCGCFGTERATANYPWHLLIELVILVGIVVLARTDVLTWKTLRA